MLDEMLPPALRDSRWFMWLPFRLVFGGKANIFFDFKDNAYKMLPEEIRGVYELTQDVHLQRETDINDACIAAIQDSIVGESVLDAGCGNGYLCKLLADEYMVSGIDFIIDPELPRQVPSVQFKESEVTVIPYPDNSFDTVICAHTLEHVPDTAVLIRELRRVALRRLIIVLPRQRSYRYTFDLHLHFFPYRYDVLALMKDAPNYQCKLIGSDWFYYEDLIVV